MIRSGTAAARADAAAARAALSTPSASGRNASPAGVSAVPRVSRSKRRVPTEGARVIVTGRIPESLDAARTELGPGATVVSSDAAAPAEVDALVEEVRELSSGAST